MPAPKYYEGQEFPPKDPNSGLPVLVYQGGKFYPKNSTQARVASQKLMPGSVVKQETDDFDVLNGGSAVNARMNPYANDLEKKRLDLGIGRNLVMGAQNLFGVSSPASREYSDFRADLEKMRNDSLRLNKGVQTEGDAQRAWNELFKHMNDETLVAGRLREIQGYNNEAIRYHKEKVNSRRALYGIGPPDFSKLETRPDAFGTTKQPSTPNSATGGVKYLGTE